MSLTTFAKAITIWLILVLSHVGECHWRNDDGQVNTWEGHTSSHDLLPSPKDDNSFTTFTPFTPFTPFDSPTRPNLPTNPFSPPNPNSPFDSPFDPSTDFFSPSITHSPPTNAPNSPLSPSSPPNSPNSPNNPPKPSGLQVGFYKDLCPNKNVDVEATITTKVQELFSKDATLLPAIFRMQFHDCFVHGCDASILINGPSSEKTAGPNLSVRGYKFIDTLKSAAEAECPEVVSCADIIAIATKELIKLGGGPVYSVQTGRRDGLVSNAQDVRFPSPSGSVTQSILAFKEKGFTPEEMVLLFGGGHTVGKSHCSFFQDRLYEGTIRFDLTMDRNLRQQLRLTCPRGTPSNNFTFLDQNPQSLNKFDNSYFDQLLKRRGILPIDQALTRNPLTSGFVRQFARNDALFNTKFVRAMIKMQALDVLLGNEGQIRKVCSRVN